MLSNKNLYTGKCLRIIFDKVHGYLRKYNRIKFLALFHSDGKHEITFDGIRYLIMLKSDISDVYSRK